MRNIAVLSALVACLACGPAASRELSSEEWRQDLQLLAKKLPAKHENAFHRTSRQTWQQAVAELDQRLDGLGRNQILAEFGKLVALVGDGHTELWLRQEAVGFGRLPIALSYFGEDLVVFAAAEGHTELIGRTVAAFGPVPVREAYERVVPLIARDNDFEYLRSAPLYLVVPEVLNALGMAESASGVVLTLEGDAGRETVTLGPLEDLGKAEWTSAPELAESPAPLYAKRRERWQWFEYLEDSRTIYVKYDKCSNQPGEDSIKKFAAELFDFVDSHLVERFVLDLRHNTGGNYHRNAPLIEGVKQRPEINQPGRLFVVTSRTTFSAATLAAIHMKQQTEALLVGEPSRGKPNGYSDEKHLRLPNSGVEVNYSPLYREAMPEVGNAPFLAVDLPVDRTFEQYRSGHDPVLEAILAYPTPEPGAREGVR